MTVFLHGIATALPPHKLPQSVARDAAREILGPRYPAFDRLISTFETAGIDQRFSVVPLEWFKSPKTWSDRHAAFMPGAKALFLDAATKALADAGWQASDVDTIVTVTTTGIATPSLEAQVHQEMGFRDDVCRVPVFGLGCAGGVSGLSIARDLAAARPKTKVLMVVVEACSVSFRSDRFQKADIIASVLFGDGAAALCLSSEPSDSREVELGRGVQKIWPDTLKIMGWDVDDTGLGVVFDQSIPKFVSGNFRPAADAAMKASGLSLDDVERFICHPGGAKVVTALENTLDLEEGTLDFERDVLRRAGNMSAPTVLFVLEQALASGVTGQMMSCALGPGFTASFLPIKVA